MNAMTCNRKTFISFHLFVHNHAARSLLHSALLGFVLLHNPRHNDKNDGHDGNCNDHLSRHLQPYISTKFIYVFFDFLKNFSIADHIKGKQIKKKKPNKIRNSLQPHCIDKLHAFISK